MSDSAPLATCQPIAETISDLRVDCSDFDHEIQHLLGGLDALREEVLQKTEQLDLQRQQLARREQELAEQRDETARIAHRFEQQEAQLAEALTELKQIKDDLAAQPQPSSADSDPLWAETLADLRELKSQLHAAATTGRERPASDDAVQLSLLQQERAALEAELETVRGHAAQLQQQWESLQHAFGEQRLDANEELKQLRQLVEQQAQLLAATQAGTSTSESDAAGDQAPESADPVVNSVMAQFAKLQRDVSGRRQQDS